MNMPAKMYFRISGSKAEGIEKENSYVNDNKELVFITSEMTMEDAEVIKEKIEADGGKVMALIPILNA